MPRINIAINQAGDTIVEVLASIAIIGVALAGGYALSSHSLRTGIDANRRSAALSLAQGQVEFLKNSVAEGNTGLYTGDGGPFCINDADGNRMTGSNCVSLSGTPYDIAITYDNGSKVFTVMPSWERLGGDVRGETVLYYKLPDVFPDNP